MKKKILIGINEFVSNSIGISLINLLNYIDETKYTIDLIYVKSNQNIVSQIPSYVNVIDSPYSSKSFNFLKKLKIRNKYDMSLMYDVDDISLCNYILKASKNSVLYIHKNYRNIYVTQSAYDEFILSHKFSSFYKIIFSNDDLLNSFSKNDNYLNNFEVLEYVVDDRKIISLSKEKVSAVKPLKSTLFISLGSLNNREKNYTTILDYFTNLIKVNNKVHLWILGDGPDLVNIKMLISQNNLEEYITLYGFKNNPYPYLLLADYYLNACEPTDLSASIEEAHVLGKPVISITNEADESTDFYIHPSEEAANILNNALINNSIKFVPKNYWQRNQQIIKKFENLL